MNTAERNIEEPSVGESEAPEAPRPQLQASPGRSSPGGVAPQDESPTTRLSQELLTAVIAGAPIALFTLDRHGVVALAEGGLLAEGEVLAAMGLGSDGFLGRSVFDLFPDLRLEDRFQRALAGALQTSTDTLFGRTFEFRMSPLRDRTGEVVGLTVVASDITERVRTEEALRQSEERYRTLIDRVPVGVYRTTPDGQILDGNPALVGMLGCPDRESLLATNAALYYASSEVRRNWQDLLEREGIVRDFELQMRRQDGKSIWVRDNARLVRGPDGQVLYYEGILDDISRRKQMERDMLRIERFAAMGHIVAALAHEIKNPLQAIESNLEVALKYPLEPDEREESLRTCLREVENLVNITQRVLGLTRTEREPYQPTSVAQVVQDTLALLDEPLRKAVIQVTTDFSPDLPLLLGSPQQIGQVLINLVINAVEAMPQGGVLHIAASLEPAFEAGKQRLSLTLSNDGPPIPPEHIEKIFDPLFTTKSGGTGLGLFVAHNIIQQHGGALAVENLDGGQGVAFTVTLPVATIEDSPEDRARRASGEEHLP
jgi:PAS domain S-box-containing protein